MAELYLVEFKGSRKEFFYNKYHHPLNVSDHVVVEADRGEDVGVVIQKVAKDVNVATSARPGLILRRASRDDVARIQELRGREKTYKNEIAAFVRRHGLPMKVVDIECQYDGNRLSIYFTADHRVDFRELVKDLAARYKTRIELRQIGVRDEARRIGGYGICGLKQCCNTFIKDFAPITTQHAREQDLPLNPAKISGNCGRLLCCLRYEVDVYSAVRRQFPEVGMHVKTRLGEGIVERIDIFREEAVLRDENNSLFRSRADDILTAVAGEALAAAMPAAAAPVYESPLDEETEKALKKLEDSETAN